MRGFIEEWGGINDKYQQTLFIVSAATRVFPLPRGPWMTIKDRLSSSAAAIARLCSASKKLSIWSPFGNGIGVIGFSLIAPSIVSNPNSKFFHLELFFEVPLLGQYGVYLEKQAKQDHLGRVKRNIYDSATRGAIGSDVLQKAVLFVGKFVEQLLCVQLLKISTIRIVLQFSVVQL